jgi:RNA polymerase sigma factor (sigma-70 family)
MKSRKDPPPSYYIRKLNFLYKRYRILFKSYFGWTYEDFVSELTAVYYKARGKWNPDKSQLTTFIINCMTNFILDKYRDTTWQKRAPFVSFEPTTEESYNNYESTIKSKDGQLEALVAYNDPESNILAKEEITERLALVSGEEREILTLLIHEEATALEIALYLDKTEQEVIDIMSRMEKKLMRKEAHGKRSVKTIN